MREKFLQNKFGVCPRVSCERQPILPIGMSEELRTSRVKVQIHKFIELIYNNFSKVFCPRCEDVFIPKKKCLDGCDGAYFGCSFPHVFMQV